MCVNVTNQIHSESLSAVVTDFCEHTKFDEIKRLRKNEGNFGQSPIKYKHFFLQVGRYIYFVLTICRA